MQRKWQILVVVCVAIFMSGLDLFIVNIAFPDIERDFDGTSLTTLSWVLSAYAIVYAALMVPAGRWADAVGRRRLFLAGLALFTLSSAACAAAPSVGFLIGARIAQAAGAALMLPTSLGLLLPQFEAHERPIAVAIWAAAGGMAAAAGPPLGGLLVEADWRWVFLVNLPVGLAALVAGARILPEIRDETTTAPDVPSAAGLAVGIGALVVGIVQGQDWGWASAGVLGSFALAVALLAFVAWRCTHHPAPVVDPEMLKVPAFTAATVASVLFFAAFSIMLLGSILYMTTVWNEPVLNAGLMLAPGPVMAASLSVPGARLSQRIGMRTVAAIGTVLFAAGTAWWLANLGPDAEYASAFLPGGVVGGIGVALVIPTLTGAAAISVPPERFATGAAVVTMGRQVGSALGVAVLVAVIGPATSPSDYEAAWWVLIGTVLAAGAVFGLFGPGRPKPAEVTHPAPSTVEAIA